MASGGGVGGGLGGVSHVSPDQFSSHTQTQCVPLHCNLSPPGGMHFGGIKCCPFTMRSPTTRSSFEFTITFPPSFWSPTVPFVNRATGQLFPSAESKSDVEERKKSAAAQRGKNMSLIDSRRLDEQRGSKQKRIQKPNILPRDRQSTIMCSWELKRELLSLSLSLSFSCDKEKKTNAVRYHQYKHTLKASEVSIVLRPSSRV